MDEYEYYELTTNDGINYDLQIACNATCQECLTLDSVRLTECAYFKTGYNFMLLETSEQQTQQQPSMELNVCTHGNVPMSSNNIHFWIFLDTIACDPSKQMIIQNYGITDECHTLEENDTYTQISKFSLYVTNVKSRACSLPLVFVCLCVCVCFVCATVCLLCVH